MLDSNTALFNINPLLEHNDPFFLTQMFQVRTPLCLFIKRCEAVTSHYNSDSSSIEPSRLPLVTLFQQFDQVDNAQAITSLAALSAFA